eukprot:ctg_544.g314
MAPANRPLPRRHLCPLKAALDADRLAGAVGSQQRGVARRRLGMARAAPTGGHRECLLRRGATAGCGAAASVRLRATAVGAGGSAGGGRCRGGRATADARQLARRQRHQSDLPADGSHGQFIPSGRCAAPQPAVDLSDARPGCFYAGRACNASAVPLLRAAPSHRAAGVAAFPGAAPGWRRQCGFHRCHQRRRNARARTHTQYQRWHATAKRWGLLGDDVGTAELRQNVLELPVSEAERGVPSVDGATAAGPLLTGSRYLQYLSSHPRVIVIGDVHGCLEELQDLLRVCDYRLGDVLVFLGDLVTKGPDSQGVVQMARELGACTVRGNHDYEVLRWREALNNGERPPSTPPEHCRIAQQLSNEDYQWLRLSPWYIVCEDLETLFVHAGFVPGVRGADGALRGRSAVGASLERSVARGVGSRRLHRPARIRVRARDRHRVCVRRAADGAAVAGESVGVGAGATGVRAAARKVNGVEEGGSRGH